MKRILLAAFSIGLVVFLAQFSGVFHKKSQNTDVYTSLQTLPGFDRKAAEGHYFILHFWAKWCAPCAEEIPHLVSFAKLANEKLKGLNVLAVSLDESLDVSKAILPDRGANLPANFFLLLDTQHTVAEGLGSYQYPETYFYDPQGHVLEKWVGAQKWDSPEVIEYFTRKVLPKP